MTRFISELLKVRWLAVRRISQGNQTASNGFFQECYLTAKRLLDLKLFGSGIWSLSST